MNEQNERLWIVDLLRNAGDVVFNEVTWLVVLVLGAGFFLFRGIQAHNPWAYAMVAILAFVATGAFWLGVWVFISGIEERREARRERREQERFRDNAKENLAVMQAMANTQTAQARMLSTHQTALQKALPAPGDAIDVTPRIVYDPAMFDGLDLE